MKSFFNSICKPLPAKVVVVSWVMMAFLTLGSAKVYQATLTPEALHERCAIYDVGDDKDDYNECVARGKMAYYAQIFIAVFMFGLVPSLARTRVQMDTQAQNRRPKV